MAMHDRLLGIASGTLRLANEELCSYFVLIMFSYNEVYLFSLSHIHQLRLRACSRPKCDPDHSRGIDPGSKSMT